MKKLILFVLALVAAAAQAQYIGPIYRPNAVAITGGTIQGITTLGARSSGAAFDLRIGSSEALTANRQLSFVLNDAARTVTVPGTTTLPIVSQAITISGPTAARTITFPDANFTAARTDAANTFTGTQSFASALQTTASGTSNAIKIAPGTTGSKFLYFGSTPGDNSSGIMFFEASSTTTNWKVGTNITVSGAYQFIPSTAGGGTTYSTSVLDLHPNHIATTGATVPTIATNDCGSTSQGTITAGGNDNAFLVTVGTAGVTSCAITFGAAWATAPKACTISPANSTAAAQGTTLAYVSSITTTKVTISGSALASAAYYVHCL